MANRNKNFDELIAKNMQDYEYSQSYLLVQIEEHGESVQDALILAIEATGLSTYAKNNGFSIQSVSDFVHKKRECKVATIDKFMKPFGLKIKMEIEKIAG